MHASILSKARKVLSNTIPNSLFHPQDAYQQQQQQQHLFLALDFRAILRLFDERRIQFPSLCVIIPADKILRGLSARMASASFHQQVQNLNPRRLEVDYTCVSDVQFKCAFQCRMRFLMLFSVSTTQKLRRKRIRQ
jgi:hypothetical protein